MQPAERLLELVRAARDAGLRLVLSNWDFQQAFKFEQEPLLYERLRGLRTVDEMFAHVEETLRDELTLLQEHDLLDTVAVVEIMNEFESAEVGPLTEVAVGSADGVGPFVATAGYQERVREATRVPVRSVKNIVAIKPAVVGFRRHQRRLRPRAPTGRA